MVNRSRLSRCSTQITGQENSPNETHVTILRPEFVHCNPKQHKRFSIEAKFVI